MEGAAEDTPWQLQLFGDKLTTKDGEVDTMTALQGKKFIAIYFSAHWCPPCRQFTPVLGAFYDQQKEDDEDTFEVIFVSSDNSTHDFQEYFREMPWTAVPYSKSSVRQGLSSRFGVRGIPTLIVLDGTTGEIKDGNARGQVASARGKLEPVFERWANAEPRPLPDGSSMGCTIA